MPPRSSSVCRRGAPLFAAAERPPEQLERPAGFPSSDKTRPDSPVKSKGEMMSEPHNHLTRWLTLCISKLVFSSTLQTSLCRGQSGVLQMLGKKEEPWSGGTVVGCWHRAS